MNAQTKKTERTHSSEGTQAHKDKARKALNVKYYMIVHGMSRDEAQKKVESIPFDDLMSEAECNAQIIRAKREENWRNEEKVRQAEYEEAKRKRDEATRKAREEFEAAQKKAKEEAKKPKEIDEESRAFVNNMLAQGNSIAQIRGYLQFKGYKSHDIKAFIESLDLQKGKGEGHAVGERRNFMNMFLENPMSIEDFEEYMSKQSANVQKRKPMYKAMFDTFNAIHAKYQK